MGRHKFLYAATAVLAALHIIGAAGQCPSDSNCICGGTVAAELNCDVNGNTVKINVLPRTYMVVQCTNPRYLDYTSLPKIITNNTSQLKSVTFKECPLPSLSFREVLAKLGVTKTMALTFQNSKNLSTNFDRKHFRGLQDVTKLLLSVNGVTYLPDDLFLDLNNLTWLNIRSNGLSLSENLFKPLERLETLEISHNHMTNISGNIFSHLAFLRKLSLWQSNVTRFSKDLFTGVNVLEELDLSSNGLNELPSSIFNPLRKLKKLTLFSNKFTSLPSNLFTNNDGLDTIIIFNNDVQLRELPKSLFSDLTQLKQVYVQRCGLETLPIDTFKNSSLISNISLAYNQIEQLQESVFNDQINLLELDLSHNKIQELPLKIFSSLVKLENLKLDYNSLTEISSATFSSLFSLVYLNLEHNYLKTITSYFFVNNRQTMSINLAYNELTFDTILYNNTTWTVKKASPFVQLHNLKLLNLSHNEIRHSFEDWWVNGHQKLDLTHNQIVILPGIEQRNELLRRGSVHNIWISNNPFSCDCQNFIFLQELDRVKTKVHDKNNSFQQCSTTLVMTCLYDLKPVIMFTVIFFAIFCLILSAMPYIIVKRRYFVFKLKSLMYKILYGKQVKGRKEKDVMLLYSHKDEEFVVHELLPGINSQTNINYVHPKPVFTDVCLRNTFQTCDESTIVIIVLSPDFEKVKDFDLIDENIIDKNNVILIKIKNAHSFSQANFKRNAVLKFGDAKFWCHLINLLLNDKDTITLNLTNDKLPNIDVKNDVM